LIGARSFVGDEQVERPVLTRDETESSNRAKASYKQRKLKCDWWLKSKMQTGEQTAAASGC